MRKLPLGTESGLYGNFYRKRRRCSLFCFQDSSLPDVCRISENPAYRGSDTCFCDKSDLDPVSWEATGESGLRYSFNIRFLPEDRGGWPHPVLLPPPDDCLSAGAFPADLRGEWEREKRVSRILRTALPFSRMRRGKARSWAREISGRSQSGWPGGTMAHSSSCRKGSQIRSG